MSEQLLFLQHLGLALLLGSLIGLERERDRHKVDAHEFGGIRTMSLTSILGYLVWSLFGTSVFFIVVTIGFMALLVASYVMTSYLDKRTGATTEIAGLFAYLVGILMGMGETLYAAVVTLVVVLLLYFKQTLHQFAHKVEKEELYDTIKFIAIVFVVLPLLPDQNFGPLETLNPYEVWLIVVLISSISFLSYIAIKLLGSKNGIGLGGFLGGLISSTAVSFSFSHLSKTSQKVVNPFVFGILVAASAMFFRVLLTVSVVDPTLIPLIAVPLVAMGLTGFGLAAYFWFQKDGPGLKSFSTNELNLHSPFQLSSAVKFALLFASLHFITKFASEYLGDQGVYITAFISGIVDVDAISVSTADLSQDGAISQITASIAIGIVAMVNTLSKGFIAYFFGSKKVGRRVLASLLLVVAVGVVSSLIFIPTYYGFIAV